MLRYAVVRIASAIPALLALSLFTFLIMRAAPGGPFAGDLRMPQELRDAIRAAYNLDAPLLEQYLDWLAGVLRFEFGPSYVYRGYGVGELIATAIPTSLAVGGLALLVSIVVGSAIGIVSALRQGKATDHLLTLGALTGVVIPAFVIAPILQLVFGLELGLLPVAGFDGSWPYYVLPVATLAIPGISYIARIVRAGMLDVLSSRFVRTAVAKGLSRRRVLFRHVLPAAFIPVIAYLGPAATVTVTGSIVVEQIFQIPGIGRFFVDAAVNRDYPLVMSLTLIYGTMLIVLGLLSDLARMAIDPRSARRGH